MRTYNNIHQAEKPKSFTDIRDLFRSSAQVFGDKVQYFYRDDALVREFTYNDFWSTMREFGTALFDRGLSNAHVSSRRRHPSVLGDDLHVRNIDGRESSFPSIMSLTSRK